MKLRKSSQSIDETAIKNRCCGMPTIDKVKRTNSKVDSENTRFRVDSAGIRMRFVLGKNKNWKRRIEREHPQR